MNIESCATKIKVKICLEKFDGEYIDGAIPVEVIELEEVVFTDEEAKNFIGVNKDGND